MSNLPTGLETIEKWFEDGSKFTSSLSPEEQQANLFYLMRLEQAKQLREMPLRDFDDMDYTTDYISNQDAANSYLRKKKNDGEVRVNTGVVEKKVEAVVNELRAMNLRQEIRAFDKQDKEISELGNSFSKVVERSQQIERDDDVRGEIYHEMCTQRLVFIRETWDETQNRPEKHVIPGLKVFLGDINLPIYRINEQPFIVIYNSMPLQRAKKIYGHLKNFDKVKAGMPMTSDDTVRNLTDYRFGILRREQVEVIEYLSTLDNERQVIINGVMMYEPGTKMPNKFGGYMLVADGVKSISRTLAYKKPLTASAKTLQSLDNEFLRMMILKFRQALAPPMATSGKGTTSKDIWLPGTITPGLKANQFEKLVDHKGVTQSEFAMFDLIEKKASEFVGVSSIVQGQESGGEKTAKEAMDLLKQGIKMLGHSVAAAMRIERDLTYLRLYNILEHAHIPVKSKLNPVTKQVDKVFQSFTLFDTSIEKGKTGKQVVQFMDRDLEDEEKQAIFDFEEQSDKRGERVRVKTINFKKLADIEANWFVTVVQKPIAGSDLDKVMFKDILTNAAAITEITGKQVNGDSLVEKFESTWDVDDVFSEEAPPGLGLPPGPEAGGAPAPQQNSIVGSQMRASNESMAKRPSLKSLI